MTRDNPKTARENDGLGRRCQSSAVLSHLQKPIHTRRGPSRAVFGAPWGRKRAFEKPILYGPVDDGLDWDHDLQVQVEDGGWHAVSLTLAGSPRFIEAFFAAFGQPQD